MTATLIAGLAGLSLRSAWAGAAGGLLVLIRPHRKGNNRFVIGLGQIFVLLVVCGSFSLLQKFDTQMGFKSHSTPYHAAIYAHILGSLCVLFCVLRADFRWQKSVGLNQQS